MKRYPQWYLRGRRKVLSWIQGEAASRRPRYWGNLDQQEEYPGDMAFAHAERANSPLRQWKITEKWLMREKKWAPLRVWIDEVQYRARWLLHPEWCWSLRHGERAAQVRLAASALTRWIRGAVMDLPWLLDAAMGAGKWMVEWWRRMRGLRRYPRKVKIRLKEQDYAAAQAVVKERIAEAEKRHGRPVPEQIEHRMMRQGMIINALNRYLWLNTPWLECRWVDSLDPQARMSRSAVIITVGRTGRVLARYELPMFALVGWTSSTGWPEKAITLTDTLGAQGAGLGVPQGERR